MTTITKATVPVARSTSANQNGAALLDRLTEVFAKYTILPNRHAYPAIALYCAYTHASRLFQYAPRLLVTSAEKRSGKSRVLDIVGALSANPLVAANATVAALFRSLGGDEPRTVIFDEADTIFGTKMKAEQNEDLRGLINAGFMQGTPVLRTVGPKHTPTEFQVFAPVVMAAIGSLPDTIQDRAINIRMKRRKQSESVQPYRIRRDKPALDELRNELAEWVQSVGANLINAYPANPLEDRAADLWEPLLAVADAAGGAWPERARHAAVALTESAADDDTYSSAGVELLHDLRGIVEFRKSDFLASSDLVAALTGLVDSRWNEEGITGRRLADLLREYGVIPTRNSARTARGYRRTDLEDAFERYLTVQASELSEASKAA